MERVRRWSKSVQVGVDWPVFGRGRELQSAGVAASDARRGVPARRLAGALTRTGHSVLRQKRRATRVQQSLDTRLEALCLRCGVVGGVVDVKVRHAVCGGRQSAAANEAVGQRGAEPLQRGPLRAGPRAALCERAARLALDLVARRVGEDAQVGEPVETGGDLRAAHAYVCVILSNNTSGNSNTGGRRSGDGGVSSW